MFGDMLKQIGLATATLIGNGRTLEFFYIESGRNVSLSPPNEIVHKRQISVAKSDGVWAPCVALFRYFASVESRSVERSILR